MIIMTVIVLTYLLPQVTVWCRHCPTAYCPSHADGVTIHPELGAVCADHLEDEEELAFLLNLVRTQGLEDNLPCPSPSQEQMAVWRRARGAQRLTSADAETPRPVGGARRLNRFSVETPISVASPSDTPSSAGAQEAQGVLSEEKSVKRLRTSLEKLVSTETKEVKADAAVTETPSKEALSNSVEPKVKSKPKTHQKETWKVAKIEFKKEEKSTWKCNQSRCRFKGAETAEKMRRHLKFHKLTDCEIEMLAGDEDTMSRMMERLVRTEYRDPSNMVLAQGPLTIADTGEVLGEEEFTCEATEECDLAFCSEAELLDHLRQFHPPLVKKELASPHKLEVGGRGWRCEHPECGALVTCVPGSQLLASHWRLSHPMTDLGSLRFLDLETGEAVNMEQVYGYAALCGASQCGYLATSQQSYTEVKSFKVV